MYIVARGKTSSGFNVVRKGGGVHRLMNMKTEGHGIKKDFYEKTDVSHPFKSFSVNINTLSSEPPEGLSLYNKEFACDKANSSAAIC